MRSFLACFLLTVALVAKTWACGADHAAAGAAATGEGGYLGVALSDLDEDRASVLGLQADHGVEVLGVESGSPAEKYGIRTGDVLLAYNNEQILSVQQLGRLVRETPPGRKVKLQYWRNGKTGTLSLVTGSAKHRDDDAIPAEWAHMQYPGPLSSGADIPSPLLLWRSSLLGILCEPVDSQLAEYFGVQRGVLVRFVMDDSPAKKAGFKAGDVVTSVGGQSVATPRDITAALRLDRHGKKTIPVSVTRNHKEITLHVEPPAYPY